MYERTLSLFTFSKSYAMTGLRLGYVAVKDPKLRERMKKALFYTCTNVTSVVQFGGIGALEGSQDCIAAFRTELEARRDLFYSGFASTPAASCPARRRVGRSTRSCASIRAGGRRRGMPPQSLSWATAEHLISRGRIGCMPGVDFGPTGEGYVRFCFARDRRELTGALSSMRELFAGAASALRGVARRRGS